MRSVCVVLIGWEKWVCRREGARVGDFGRCGGGCIRDWEVMGRRGCVAVSDGCEGGVCEVLGLGFNVP